MSFGEGFYTDCETQYNYFTHQSKWMEHYQLFLKACNSQDTPYSWDKKDSPSEWVSGSGESGYYTIYQYDEAKRDIREELEQLEKMRSRDVVEKILDAYKEAARQSREILRESDGVRVPRRAEIVKRQKRHG